MSAWFPPVDFDFGDDCLRCYSAGNTTLTYYIMLHGIERGALWIAADGMPPNWLHIVTQHVFVPCRWVAIYAVGDYIHYEVTALVTRLSRYVNGFVPAFESEVGALCRRFHVNELVNPATTHFYGGQGFVFTPREMQDLLEYYTPVVDPDPLLKVSPIAGEQIVLSYIDSWGDTAIKLLVDTDY